MGSQEIIKIEDDFILIRFQNDGTDAFQAQREVSSGLIQFHFGLKGILITKFLHLYFLILI